MAPGLQRPAVDVIIPTLALPERRESLLRVLGCLEDQEGVCVTPIVVVNGPSPDAATVRRLEEDRRIRLVQLCARGIPGALRAGRSLVKAEFFGAVDDDDLLLPGTLAARAGALRGNPRCGGVVSNGIRRSPSGDALHVRQMSSVATDPMRAFLLGNWLLPGSWLVRSNDVPAEFFEPMPEFLECSYLALALASQLTLCFIEEPGVIWHTDSPGAAHCSIEHLRNQPGALVALQRLSLPVDVKRALREHWRRACHVLAEAELQAGNGVQAWGWHLRSLLGPGGWRHIPFTRRMLAARYRSVVR